MDIYDVLNYRLLDTSSEIMLTYNWIYKPFNVIEAIIWIAYIPKTIWKYGNKKNKNLITLQCFNFRMFSMTDLVELSATTVILVLWKLAILLALVATHKALNSNNINNAVA
jgi:hypothetical protein